MSNSDNQDWRAILAEQQRRRNAILDPQHSNTPVTPAAGQKPNSATTSSVPQQKQPTSSENKAVSTDITSTTSGTKAGASSERTSALGGLRRRRSYSETVRSTPPRPYTRYAFENIYNLTLLAGSTAISLIDQNPWLFLMVGALEAAWLIFAPQSRLLQRALWNPRYEQERAQLARKTLLKRLEPLDEEGRARVHALIERHNQIKLLAEQNPSLANDLLKDELVKTEDLVNAFIDMAITSARYEGFLEKVNTRELKDRLEECESEIKRHRGKGPQAQVAKQNAEIIQKRLARRGEVEQFLETARAQLSLLEDSFAYIADEVVTMRSPEELSGQLNDLLQGVDEVKRSAAEVESLYTSDEEE
jgi:hypothetical protein